MAKHHPDLVFCRKQPGIALGRLCEKCDGKCVICDSYVRPHVLVHVCDECNYGSFEGRCIICGAPGISDAYYCRECTLQEKDVSFIHKRFNFCWILTLMFFLTFIERWMSQNHKYRKLANRSVLWTEKVRVQKEIAIFIYHVIIAMKTLLSF
jgi:PHD finger-like domain-containing protein 5A